MFTSLLEDNKISFNVIIFLFIGVLFYYIYAFNVQLKFKKRESFKSRPQKVEFQSKNIEKEMKKLKELKDKYLKACKSQNNIETDVISNVFDVKEYPEKMINTRLQQLKEQKGQKLLKPKRQKTLKNCLPKLTFDGI